MGPTGYLILSTELRFQEACEIRFHNREIKLSLMPCLIGGPQCVIIGLAILSYPLWDNLAAWEQSTGANA